MTQGNEESETDPQGQSWQWCEVIEGGLRRKWTAVKSCKENKELKSHVIWQEVRGEFIS